VSDESVILINLLMVKPGKQEALIALLKQSTHTVVCTLHGWKTTRLIAAKDGAGVVIYSEWENLAAVEAMRSDPRMRAYIPKIVELASLESIVGSAVLSEARRGSTHMQVCNAPGSKGEPQWLVW
jgi:quinol monooxygenase YgiN